jgi:hypothetical protein
MIVGGVMTIVWEALGQPFGLQSVLISAPLAVITLIVVGNMTYKPKEA